ncbi:MAG: Trk system potassium transporter TrkA [Albidovulum sp.]|nr:Trk system potassium transporter TrkA [Albidovulum sp.]MDE0532341.1 Trk system potassium transporter TrkA [Albidovulum sp.]
MKIVVCGAGQVGGQIIKHLSAEEYDLTIIDRDADLVRRTTDQLDVKGIAGYASHPDVLMKAGAAKADALIAATSADEVNVLACVVARGLGSKARTIARIREPQYDSFFASGQFSPVDVVISPENEIAQAVLTLLETPSVFDRRSFLDSKALMVAIHLEIDCPVVNTPLRQLSELFSDLMAVVVGYRRHGTLLAAKPEDQMFVGDEVYIFVAANDLNRTLEIFGRKSEACERVIVIGAGNIGLAIARALDSRGNKVRAKVIELDRTRAENAADLLMRTVVLHGDGLDTEILDEANVSFADAVVAVTADDKTNLLAATRAKNAGKKLIAISLVNEPALESLKRQLNIDAVLNPRATTVSSILPHIRTRGIGSIYSIGDAEAEIIEMQVDPGSPIQGKALRAANLPEGALLGAIKKGGRLQRVMPDTKLDAGDTVAFFSLASDVGAVVELLRSDAGRR